MREMCFQDGHILTEMQTYANEALSCQNRTECGGM